MKTKQQKQQSANDKKLAKAYAKREKRGTIGPMQVAAGAVGTLAGGMLGGPFGAGAGFTLGSAAGKLAGYFTGSGDYTVSQNAILNANFKNATGTVITHREYITDVYSGSIPGGSTSTAFDISSYPINPGQTRTFPWLASIASNYEEYEILGMVFSFVATSGDSVASTNTSLGSVILATEYDPTKPAFANKQAMENYQFSSSAKPSQSQVHAIECKKNLTPVKMLYVRTGALTGTDLRWTDFANFHIATVGHPSAGVNLGELWCTYKIKLNKPRLPITVGYGGQIASTIVTRTGPVTANPTGTVTVRTVGTIPITFPTANTFSFPAYPNMNYMVTAQMNSGVGLGTPLLTIISGAVARNFFIGGVSSGVASVGGPSSSTSYYMECTNTDTDGNIVVQYTQTITSGLIDIIVTQYDETV